MKAAFVTALILVCCAASAAPSRTGHVAEPRLREVIYDPDAIIVVPVKRGVVTLVRLEADEAISEAASGLGADCSKPEATWCIAAQPSGHDLFVKPKSGASASNNLAVVTSRRSYAFRFEVLADNDPRPPVYQLVVKSPPKPPVLTASPEAAALAALPPVPPLPSPAAVIGERMHAKPLVRNAQYSLAVGTGSDDILPSLVFDDGRFTYFRFPGNREVPAVFHVLADGSETLVNARMEDDLLVADRVSRQLVLRAGSAVVSVRNEAFDLDGAPAIASTTVPGVARAIKFKVEEPTK